MRALASLALVAALGGGAHAGNPDRARRRRRRRHHRDARFTSRRAASTSSTRRAARRAAARAGRSPSRRSAARSTFGAPVGGHDAAPTGSSCAAGPTRRQAPLVRRALSVLRRPPVRAPRADARPIATTARPRPSRPTLTGRTARSRSWRLELGARGGHAGAASRSTTATAPRAPGGPWVEVVSATGAPYQWAPPDPPLDRRRVQLVARREATPPTRSSGTRCSRAAPRLTALVTPFSGGAAYHAAKAVTYEIVDAAGQAHAVVGDQRERRIELGSCTLGKDSVVRLKATGERRGDRASPARCASRRDGGARPSRSRSACGTTACSPTGRVTLVVKDFWQHHPITLCRTATTIGWEAIERPAEYTGGMGLTLESMIALDGPPAAAVGGALRAAAARRCRSSVHAVDGSLAHGPIGDRYDALLKVVRRALRPRPRAARTTTAGATGATIRSATATPTRRTAPSRTGPTCSTTCRTGCCSRGCARATRGCGAARRRACGTSWISTS